MFVPDDCPNLVDIKRSLKNHTKELYKELETPRVEPGYRCFLQALLSKAEEQLKKEEEEESSFNDVNELVNRRKMNKSDVQKLNQHASQVRPRSGVDGSMQIRAARKIGNRRGKELLKKKLDTDVLRLNHKQALSSKKSNAENSRVSKAIQVDIEDSSEPEHDSTIRLGKRVEPVQSGSRNVVNRRNVDKGKSVIQVEDPVHENTNQRPNPKDQVGRIDKAPYVMDKAHDTRKLREAVKGKNVVRGDQMDQGRSYQKPGPGNNLSPKKLSEHVEKGKAQNDKGLKRPAASTYAVIQNHYKHGDSAQRLKEGEIHSRKQRKKMVEEERESSLEIIALSPPRSARIQLGNNSQVQSSEGVISRQLRNVKFGESSRPKKKICKNNLRKKIDDEAASLHSAAFLEGNLGPFGPSKGDAYEHNGRAHVHSEFRANVLNVLKRPFDQEEYHKLHEAVQNGSYLKTYPDLRAVLVKNRYFKEKRLTMLRGFFFWLQNLTQQDAFEPWTDRECLAVLEQDSG